MPPVVHVSAHYPPFLGGLEKVVQALAAYRRARNLDVKVLTSRDRLRSADCAGESGTVQRLRSWEVAHTAIIPGLPGSLLRLPRQSVIHLHVSQAFVPEAVLMAHRLCGLPFLAHVHIDVGPSGPLGGLLRAYKPLVLGPVLRAAASVVVFTDEQRAALAAAYGLDRSRIRVIPNGVDDTFFYPAPRIPPEKPRLLFVGRLAVQKNLPLLLHALTGISERFETVIVGAGELEAELKSTTVRLELANVQFYGRADSDDLRELYRTADIFVLPSEREGMPLVLLEAMAMGLPVVATDIPGNRDVIVDGVNGTLVPLDDPQALRQALLTIATDTDLYRRMSEASGRFSAQYSWGEIGARFENIYAEVANG